MGVSVRHEFVWIHGANGANQILGRKDAAEVEEFQPKKCSKNPIKRGTVKGAILVAPETDIVKLNLG